MITPEMLRYLLLQCSAKGYITTELAMEVIDGCSEPINIYALEALIDVELQIMSLAEALEILEEKYNLD